MGLVERIARRAAGWLLAAALCAAPLVQALTHGPSAPDGAAWGVEAAAHGHAHGAAVAEEAGEPSSASHDASDHEHQTLALLPAQTGSPRHPSARARRRGSRRAGPSAREGPRRPPRCPSA